MSDIRTGETPSRSVDPWRVLLVVIVLFCTVYIVYSPFGEHEMEVVYGTSMGTATIQGRVDEIRKLENRLSQRRLANTVGLQAAWVCLTVAVAGLANGPRRS